MLGNYFSNIKDEVILDGVNGFFLAHSTLDISAEVVIGDDGEDDVSDCTSRPTTMNGPTTSTPLKHGTSIHANEPSKCDANNTRTPFTSLRVLKQVVPIKVISSTT